MLLRLEKSKKSYSSYCDVLGGDVELGLLISSIHTLNIKMGHLLEKLILTKLSKNPHISAGIKIKVKPNKNVKPDIIYEDSRSIKYHELKFGVVFDTKKSVGEIQTLNSLYDLHLNDSIDVEAIFVSWSANNKEEIIKGLKLKEAPKNIMLMTGREFCYLYGLKFNSIIHEIHEITTNNKKILLNTIYDYMII